MPRGGCLQPGDQRQDIGEHLSRHRDLSQLEGDVSGRVERTFAPILISFSRRLVSGIGGRSGMTGEST
jgi:hypothetical protein